MSAERVRGCRRAPRSGSSGPLRRRIAGAVAVTASLALALGPLAAAAVPAHGSAGFPAPVAAGSAPVAADGTLSLVAAPAASGIARPGEPISVRVTVTNLDDEATPELTIELDVAGALGPDADVVARWVAGEAVEVEARTVASAVISPLESGSSAVLDLIVPNASTVLSGDFGARLAAVRASSADSAVAADRIALVWLGPSAGAPAVPTLFVAPLTTPGVPDGYLSGNQLETLTAEAGALTRQLDAVAGRPVVVGIDPRVVVSIRRLGDAAPASARAFLERLRAIPNETFLLPWADADLAAALAAGATEVPQPEGVGTEVGGDDTGTPSSSPSPGPTLPPRDDAASWPVTLRDTLWVEHAFDSATLTPLQDAGIQVLLTPSTALDGPATVQEAEGLRLLRVDTALSAAARAASTATSQQRFDRAIAELSALLAASAADAPGTPALIALTRDVLPSNNRLVDTIARTISLPWSIGGTVTEMLSTPPVPATLVTQSLEPDRLTAIQDALTAEAADRAFAAIATTPTAITDRRRLELLSALSVGWGSESIRALRGFTDDSVTLRQSVRVAESSSITLLSDRASLPVTVQNNLDVAVRVYLRVEPDTTQLRVLDPRVEVLVEPRSQTRALVPVESLTNGQVAITVTVRDAEGTRIGTPTRVSLNLQAGWETAGTIAVAAALVVLLAAGLTRDIRKRRRRGEDAA